MAALFVAIALVLRLSLSFTHESFSPFLLFLVAVMASAWFGGTGPALFVTVCAALVCNYFFMAPYWSFGMGTKAERMEFVLFLTEGTVTTMLAGRLHRARDVALAGQSEARALQAELLRVSDEERRRIGHDLHDDLGQQLTGVALLSKVLGQRLAERSMAESEQAQQIATLANTVISQIKDIARGLDPVPIRSEGLVQALRELCVTSAQVFQINCIFRAQFDTMACDSNVATHLFRIAQEAISNAVKHGSAREIVVGLERGVGAIVLSIRNDGTAFHPPESSGGLGLRIMRYRARMIDARLEIFQTDDAPTLLLCTVPDPLKKESNNDVY